MRLNVKQTAFIVAMLAVMAAAVYLRYPFKIITSLSDLLPSDGDGFPVAIVNKYSGGVNAVVKAQTFAKAKTAADTLYAKLMEEGFRDLIYGNKSFSLSEIISFMARHKNSYLGKRMRSLIADGKKKEVVDYAADKITASWMPPVVPIADDPFLLLSDYVTNMKRPPTNWQIKDGVFSQPCDGGFCILMRINSFPEDTEKMAVMVKRLRDVVAEVPDAEIHLSGLPLHTADMFIKSKREITLFSVISATAAVLLTYFLFLNIKAVVVVAVNLAIAVIGGCMLLVLAGSNIYLMAFVFGTSLIGICIDYSFHKMSCDADNDKKKVNRNILYSFLTTALCFSPLLFSSLPLLRQVALFTIGGLATTYCWVCLFSDYLFPVKGGWNIPVLPKRAGYAAMALFTVFVVCGILRVKTSNSPSDFYSPSDELAAEEKFFYRLNGQSFSRFLVIRGATLQQVLETEEALKDGKADFFSVSSLVPSIKRQLENRKLIGELYASQAKNIKERLGLKATPVYKETPLLTDVDIKSDLADWAENFIFYDDSKVWSVIPVPQNITVGDTEGARIISPKEQIERQLDAYAGESFMFLGICLFLLSVLMFGLYGKRVAVYLLPSLAGIAGTVSILSVCGQPITFFHVMSLFIVVGLGIDYAIFHLDADNLQCLKQVMYSFLTSFIGFGILSLAGFFIVKAMGMTISIGLLISYLLSLSVFRKGRKDV